MIPTPCMRGTFRSSPKRARKISFFGEVIPRKSMSALLAAITSATSLDSSALK
jgi:hypothetical protein